MAHSKWKITTAGLVAAGLGATGMVAANAATSGDGGSDTPTISLTEQAPTSVTGMDAPVEVTVPDDHGAKPADGYDERHHSVDSPDTGDHADHSVDSRDSFDSADSPDSFDSPDASVDSP